MDYELELLMVKLPRIPNTVRKPGKKRGHYRKRPISVDFKLLFQRFIRIMFEQVEIKQLDLFRILERQYQNGHYFQDGVKSYRLKGYKRVKEIITACRLLGILLKHPKDNTGDNEVQQLNLGKGILTEADKQSALRMNDQSRLGDKICHVFYMYHIEYVHYQDAKLKYPEGNEQDDAESDFFLSLVEPKEETTMEAATPGADRAYYGLPPCLDFFCRW